MRRLVSLIVFLPLGLVSFGQSYYDVGPSKNPRAVFAAIAPFYDFMDANLKPWHLKMNYELEDEKGNPTRQGVFEYWWVSPKVYRSAWTRREAMYSEWHTADGKILTQTTGEPLSVYEYWLRSTLLSPIPTPADLDAAKSILVDHSDASSNAHTRCMMIVPSEIKDRDAHTLPFGTYPEYCVNKAKPILLGYYFFQSLLIKCVNFTEMQGKSMPREILIGAEAREILSAKVEPVETITPSDPALTPPPDAATVSHEKVQISPEEGSALVVKRVAPVSTDNIKIAPDRGKVILRTTIGVDG
ncbi:MAG: hypothetical protein WBQ94_12335, partial [Terracidiphilus sp.]